MKSSDSLSSRIEFLTISLLFDSQRLPETFTDFHRLSKYRLLAQIFAHGSQSKFLLSLHAHLSWSQQISADLSRSQQILADLIKSMNELWYNWNSYCCRVCRSDAHCSMFDRFIHYTGSMFDSASLKLFWRWNLRGEAHLNTELTFIMTQFRGGTDSSESWHSSNEDVASNATTEIERTKNE